MARTFEIVVLKKYQDLARSLKEKSCRNCPVALAASAVIGDQVGVGKVAMYSDRFKESIDLPMEVVRWIAQWDSNSRRSYPEIAFSVTLGTSEARTFKGIDPVEVYHG